MMKMKNPLMISKMAIAIASMVTKSLAKMEVVRLGAGAGLLTVASNKAISIAPDRLDASR